MSSRTISGRVRPSRPLQAAALLLASLLAVAVPSAANAAPSPTGQEHGTGYYLALGDSLAAGYQPNRPAGARDDKTGGYVGQVLDAVRTDTPKTRLVNLACSGATSTTMVAGGGACTYDDGTQVAQALEFLHAHGNHTRLVTLTVGANDVTPCLSGATQSAIIACTTSQLQTYSVNLRGMIRDLRTAAPRADIVVTNYYNPFLALYLDPARRALVPLTTQLQMTLNQTIAAAAGGRADVADVATEFSSFNTAPVSATDPTPTNVAVVCAWTWMCTPFKDIHANDAGYAAIALAVIDEL